jgi:hypothetical protein
VHAKMRSLNSENDLQFLKPEIVFQKLKRFFWVKLKIISFDHHFQLYQTAKIAKNENIFDQTNRV